VNVLILHQHFKTPQEGGALRSYFLGKALVERGFTVTVITAHNQPHYAVKNIEGISVHYLGVLYSNHFGFWKRIFSFLKFIVGCIRISGRFKQVDLCYAISVPLTIGWAARWIKWRHGIPYIFEVGDLWPDAPIELDVIQNPFLKNLLWRMEKKIYRQADSIVALSPAIANAIEQKVPGKKILVIPNLADTTFFQPESKQQSLEEKFGVRGKFVIAYFGAMGFANGLDYLLACASNCQKENLPVQFMLAGDGVERNNLIKKAASVPLKNTSFHSFQHRAGIHELMNVADAVFVCYRHASILETGSPNKFFDGLAAGKLILINFGGWIRKEVEAAPCGFYVDPEKPETIIPALKAVIGSSQLADYQRRSRELAVEKFSRQQLTGTWIEFLNQRLHVIAK
jgi:glycosyltransferase involved in cell wall biosynthesis